MKTNKKIYTEKDIIPGFVYFYRIASLLKKKFYINIILKELNENTVLTTWQFSFDEFARKTFEYRKKSIVDSLNKGEIEELLPLKP